MEEGGAELINIPAEEISTVNIIPERKKEETVSEYLRRLQTTGKYLFHGSPYSEIKQLEPKPATDVSGDPWSNDEAVFAVADPAIAVQRALLPPRDTIRGEWVIGGGTNPENPEQPYLQITENIDLGNGSLYIVAKGCFEMHPDGGQYKSKESVRPLSEIEVKPEDYKSFGGVVEILKQD